MYLAHLDTISKSESGRCYLDSNVLFLFCFIFLITSKYVGSLLP